MSNSWSPNPSDMMIQQLLQYLMQGGSGVAQAAPAWQGAADPSLLGGLTFGYDPTMQQNNTFAGMIPPSQDPEDAGSLEEAQRQGNYFQDMIDMTADPVVAAMMGGGSYSADAFAPTVERELIPRPATNRFNQWLLDDTSFEGMVAKAVQQGRSPRSAIINMREVIESADKDAAENGENADPQLAQLAQQYQRMLPDRPQDTYPGSTPLTGASAINWTDAFQAADDLVQPYFEEQQTQPGPIGEVRDPQGNLISSGGEIVEGDDGQLYRVTTTDSPLAEKYHELGIPLPTEQYDVGDLLGTQWQQAEQSYLNELPALADTYRQLSQDRNRALSNATGDNLSQSDVFAMDQQAALDRGNWEGGSTAASVSPQEQRVRDQDPNMVEPVAATTTATQDLVNEAISQATPDAMIDFINAHQGEFSADQLDSINQAVQHHIDTSRGTQAEFDWSRVQGTIGHRESDVTPPDAVTQEAMTLAQQAQAQGGNQQLMEALPFFRGNGMLGQDINDVVKNDPRALAEWLTTNWSSMSDDQRRDATTFVDITAGEQTMNLAQSFDPESVQQRALWQNLREGMSQLQGGTNVIDWNADQGATHRGGGRSRMLPSGLELGMASGLKPMGGAGDIPGPGGGGGANPNPPANNGMGPNGPVQPPPGGSIHNGAIFDAQGRLVGYVPGAGQMQQPTQPQPTAGIGGMTDAEAPIERGQGQPASPTMDMLLAIMGQQSAQRDMDPNLPGIQDQQMWFPTGAPGSPTTGPPAEPGQLATPSSQDEPLPAAPGGQYTPPPGYYWHNGAWFDGNDRLVGYALGPGDAPGGEQGPAQGQQPQVPQITPQYTGPGTRSPSLDMLLAIMGQQRQPRPGPSGGTSPNQSEQAGRGTAVQTSNASTRTGPEPSEQATRPALWDTLTRGQKRPDQQTAMQMLRFMLGGRDEDQGGGGGDKQGGGRTEPNGKQKLYFGTHQASPVDTYRMRERATATRADRAAREQRYAQNMDYRALYGRDYWQARGYAEALRSMGVTPTSVSMANRMGGLNRVMGRT